MTVTIETPEAMRELGEQVASLLRPGDLVVLSGPLGAGKTVFAQGVGRGLGVSGAVVSPTFVIARVNRGGRLPLVHVDAYRLSSIDEVDDLDLDASLEDSVTLVEWGEGLVEGLAGDRLHVAISRARDGIDDADGTGGTGGTGDSDADDTRTVSLIGVGVRWSDVALPDGRGRPGTRLA